MYYHIKVRYRNKHVTTLNCESVANLDKKPNTGKYIHKFLSQKYAVAYFEYLLCHYWRYLKYSLNLSAHKSHSKEFYGQYKYTPSPTT